MAAFSAPKLTEQDKLESLARVLVRAGTLDTDACVAEVAVAAREDARVPDAEQVARDLVSDARDALYLDQEAWPPRTDYDRLQAAFADLAGRGIEVLQSVDDHWRATEVLRGARGEGNPLAGVVWFTAPDVWHAIEHGMLEVNVWHGDTANVAEGDDLERLVVATLAEHDLAAHFDEGRIEVSAFWHRRVAA